MEYTVDDLFGDAYDERPPPRSWGDVETEPCAHCGKAVRLDQEHWRIEYYDQGWYAIGSECVRKYRTENPRRWQPTKEAA